MIDPEEVLKQNIGLRGAINKEYIFQDGLFGKKYRAYFIPSNPKTEAQQINRSLHHCAVRSWGHLTPEIKEEWRNKRGPDPYYMKGFYLFVSQYIKEGKEMAVKSIQRGHGLIDDDITLILINEVDTSRSIILSPDGDVAVYDGVNLKRWGVLWFEFSDSTHIEVKASVPSGYPRPNFNWTVVEFV